jgi:methionyl aminopeptidase
MKAWEIVTEVHKALREEAKEGVSLLGLNFIAEKIVAGHGGICYNKGYRGAPDWPEEHRPKTPFPTGLVVNVNSVIVHGIPNEYKLKSGDVVGFDIGVKKDGLCGDAGFTMGIGKIENKNARLIYYTRRALYEGIKHVKAGVNVKDIASAIERYVVTRGYVVNENFSGHGIGKEMHEPPFIPNYDSHALEDYFLKEGEMICLEPIVTFTSRKGVQAGEWAWVTKDGKCSAFFEHQLLVTKDGCEILTKHIDENETY